MRVATVAFYGCALGLLAMGLREMFSGFEENRCTMTYMFEYPEYRRIALPRRVARQYPAYGLYLYGEGQYAQDTRGLKLTGAPVLFLPGNAGSYKQARSLGSVALRKAEALEGGVHLNVFTIDFNEELVALYGGSLRRQTHFLHESIKAILRLYKDHEAPPHSVVLVGHSMGGVVARALFTLPRFSPRLVSLIITQASPHQAPVLSLDAHLLEFYSAVRQRWVGRAEDLRNVTVLSVGGGYRDYQVRSGLTALPCPQDDPSKLSLVVTAVPRTWVSTDHLSIVWCKELVLATVRAFFDLIEPETGQFSDDPERRMAILHHHFIRHPVRVLGEQLETPVSLSGSPKTWSEVNTLRLAYSAPKEGQAKYFLFALSSRRRAYSHFYCRSNNLEMTSWVYGCTQMNGSMCVQAVDLSFGTELLPAYKVLTLSLRELSSVSHLIVVASNLNGRQFTVECEWQRQESQTVSLPVPHVLSFGMSVSDVTLNSTGLRHTIELQHFHQVYQAFRISVVSHCKVTKTDRLPNVYIMKVPWFREDSVTTSSIPSVTEISGMLHTSRPDNSTGVLLQLHTAPNCHYKVSVRTSFPRVLGQVLRFCGPVLPVYVAVALLLACGGQMSSVVRTGRPLQMSHAVARSLQPHKVDLPVYLLHLLLRYSWFQDGWSTLHLPPLDALPATSPDGTTQEGLPLNEDWPRLLSPLLYVLGAAMAFWGSVLLRLFLRLLSLLLAPLHRPSVSRDCGTLCRRTQLLLILCLSVLGWASCGALSITATFLLHLYRVLRLQMTERSLSHMLNLAPEKQTDKDNGTGNKEKGTGEKEKGTGEKEKGTGEKEKGTGEKEKGTGEKEKGTGNSDSLDSKPKECNGAPLLSDSVLQDVRDDLQLHISLSALLTLPVMLCAPSLIHWTRNLRYSVACLDPDPCWPHSVPLFIASLLLINCNTLTLSYSKTLPITSRLLLPLSVAMVTFSPLHLYRVNYFVSAALVPLAVSCLF
ncbi:GPI inositol-deacylase isoform X2 [Salvelinus sp. IW2-2015]|uniref:GPI inositol-deacylase isoform X2 n=1 Tax=Salvelinus sp. IW2-2015 TaxID=2691554 RepID=UPI000CDFA364|nr:GPI inositol-deacylase isoform X2 [Salvelinus alpinus]